MIDYKDTLNLPQTDFPMKANLSQREPDILKKWEAETIYATQRQERAGKQKFILHMGPPYANGHIHLGTATTTLLKDMIVKSKSLSGYDAPLVPGWDCHGLPIELNVEKKIGKPGQKVSAADFRAACREYAASYIDIQRESFKRLGMIADWEHPYLTMDFHYEANIIRSLAAIMAHQHVQKGYKPVHWCLDCASALAEAEVEYIDKASPSIDVRFTVVDTAAFMQRFEATSGIDVDIKQITIPIWTTTPWSLPANQAVALNPTLDYVLVEDNHAERWLIAETLSLAVMQRYGLKETRRLGRIKGEKLAGLWLRHPFYEKEVPLILSDHVTIDAGTGAVHIAPVHGPDDYALGQRYHLSMDNPVGDDGCFTAATPLFAGLHVNKANASIMEVLRAQHTLIHDEILTHSYPHCWRHKSAVIFRATPQWFISMDAHHLREMAEAGIERVTWIPDWGKARIQGMIANRPDWCISRQRAWGVPIPLFIHKETGDLHPQTLALMEKVAERVAQVGIEAWYQTDEEGWLGAEGAMYVKCKDVLDVWFDSGVSHACVLKVRPELAFPADIVLEGSDQHRGWFQSSLLTAMAMYQTESYKQVLTHGFVVDGQGRKMSKSIGNVIAPEDIIKTLGADVLRLWVASIDYRYEIAASKEILARTSETYRRIRNTARFLLANLHGFDPQVDLLTSDAMLVLDRWAVHQAYRMQQEVIAAYEHYQFHVIIQRLHHFCVNEMGGFYLDIIKDRQYTLAANSRGRRSAQTALFHIVQAMVRWLAPILSFTAEEIWQYMPGQDVQSVFLSTWYEALTPLRDDEPMNEAYWEVIRAVREAVNKEIENQRNAGQIGSALEAEVFLYCNATLKTQLDALGKELRFVLITSAVEVNDISKMPTEAVQTEVPGLALQVKATTAEKCVRCWHRVKTVNHHAAYPGLCDRCIENISGAGEIRLYA